MLTSCSARRAPAPTASVTLANSSDFIDLQPGWRLQVVTLLQRAADLNVKITGSDSSGKVLTATIDGSIGSYEVAFYAVEPRRGGGVRVRFVSAETIRDGKATPQPASLRPLFVFPKHLRHMRLLFLTRASQVDHDMAVIGSDRMEKLDLLTRAVQSEGLEGCKSDARSHCSWIPAGVAVRPELQRVAGGPWMPAR